MVNVKDQGAYQDSAVNKVANIKTDQLGADTYYFKPGQVLSYHKHPNSDQIFLIVEGEGKFYLDDGGREQVIDVKCGSLILAPANVWHQLENTGGKNLVATQVTKLPATGVQRT